MAKFGAAAGAIAAAACALAGCSGGAGEESLVDWKGDGTAVHATNGCYDMPGGPRGMIVTATSTNTSGNSVRIPNPCGTSILSTSGGSGGLTHVTDFGVTPVPNQTFAVSQVWNPPGSGGVYNDHHVGVWFDGTSWNVFNEDGAAMPLGASFSVAIADLETATVDPSYLKRVRLADATSPSTPLITTHVWNKPGSFGVYDDHELALQFVDGSWAITNADFTLMPAGASFYYTQTGSFTMQATAANTVGDWAAIDSPLTNGKPDAIVLVTENLTPPNPKVAPVAVPSAVGVWYDAAIAKWAVFRQDVQPMPLGASFNVWVVPKS